MGQLAWRTEKSSRNRRLCFSKVEGKRQLQECTLLCSSDTYCTTCVFTHIHTQAHTHTRTIRNCALKNNTGKAVLREKFCHGREGMEKEAEVAGQVAAIGKQGEINAAVQWTVFYLFSSESQLMECLHPLPGYRSSLLS